MFKKLFASDALGHSYVLKRLLIGATGIFLYPRFMRHNKLRLFETELLKELPDRNVLFVCNHETYFADVIGLYMAFFSFKNGFGNNISTPFFFLRPKLNSYYVAAEETMKAGLMPKILTYAGCVSIKRTFREAGKDINRQVDMRDFSNIGLALSDGWVVTFPQGTTTPFAPGRRGTIHIIKKYKPIVVPVVIKGFSSAFVKKGLKLAGKGVEMSIRFKSPLNIDYEDDANAILQQIMHAIEQTEEFRKEKNGTE